jgi:acyl dehydratase
VHGEQEYTFERPVLVGDTLSGESTLTGVYQRESSSGNCLTFAVVETVFRDEEGQVVVTERSTYLEVGDDE